MLYLSHPGNFKVFLFNIKKKETTDDLLLCALECGRHRLAACHATEVMFFVLYSKSNDNNTYWQAAWLDELDLASDILKIVSDFSFKIFN